MMPRTLSSTLTSNLTAVTTAAALALLAVPAAHAFTMIQTPSDGTWTGGRKVSCNASGGFAHWSRFDYRDIAWRVNSSALGFSAVNPVRQAANTWNNVGGADHRMTVDGATTAGWAVDGQNTVVFERGNGCFFSSGCYALTMLVIEPGQVIVEADITFARDSGIIWGSGNNTFDIQAVATHELGHALGIHHSEVGGTPTMQEDIALHGTAGRTLVADDRAALQCSQQRYGIQTLRAQLDGPSSLYPNYSGYFSCPVTGGLPPYQRQWYKFSQSFHTLGTGSGQSTSDSQSFLIECHVWDSSGQYTTSYRSVTVGTGGSGDGPTHWTSCPTRAR
ncbi:MAG: matrixin family metalloprotease, partial [Acidobacteriota bacterium]